MHLTVTAILPKPKGLKRQKKNPTNKSEVAELTNQTFLASMSISSGTQASLQEASKLHLFFNAFYFIDR